MNDINKITSSKIKLEKLNACRLHLNVLLLSYITNNKGNSLAKGILLGDEKIYRLITYIDLSNLRLTKNHSFYSLVLYQNYSAQLISQKS